MIKTGLIKDAINAMHEQEKEDATDGQLNIKKEPSVGIEVPKEPQCNWNLTNDIFAMTNKLDSILELVQDQQQEIAELRVEVTRLRQETPIANRVESVLAKAVQQQKTSIEQTLYGQAARHHEFLKSLEVSVKEKIESTIPRVIHEIVEPLKRQFRIDAQQIGEIVKENLTKSLASSQMREVIATTASSAAKPALEHAFKDSFTGNLLPGMEKACQNMFKQVQDAFLIGTRECK